MKVSFLRRLLAELPPEMDDAPVLLQVDQEGNGYNALRGVDPDALVIRHGRREIDVYDSNWTAEEAGMDDDEWKATKEDGQKAVILFP